MSVAEVPSGKPGNRTEGGPPAPVDPPDVPTVDVLGIGFGPSNLALAIAVEEYNATAPPGQGLAATFVEQQAAFGWHRGMLLDGATMQVSFLKDLVTMRNPTSELSFLSYLYEHGRLADFINNKSLFPSRIEFHDYLEWAASGVRDLVSYGTRADDVRPVRIDPQGSVDAFEVELTDVASGRTSRVRARNVVLATGMTPTLPDGMESGPRIWHNSQLTHRLDALDACDDPSPARRFVVVGAGQSAAETAEHLHSRYADAEVRAVFSRYGYSPADDTSFANRIFDPAAVDHFYTASDEVKRMLMDYHSNTNYSVVDPELINELYRRAYQEKVAGTQRLHVHSASRLGEVRLPTTGDGGGCAEVDIAFLPTGDVETVETDVVVYATGYRSVDPASMLGEAAAWCARDGAGELLVERDYRLVTDAPLRAGVYVQGPTEHSHGISSTLLSTTAVRAGEIVSSLVAHTVEVPDTVPSHDVVAASSGRQVHLS